MRWRTGWRFPAGLRVNPSAGSGWSRSPSPRSIAGRFLRLGGRTVVTDLPRPAPAAWERRGFCAAGCEIVEFGSCWTGGAVGESGRKMSITGAAFVTPDKAMQEVAWTEAEAKGPGKIKMRLTIPSGRPRHRAGHEEGSGDQPALLHATRARRRLVPGHRGLAVPAIPEGQKPWTLTDWRNKAAFGKMLHRFQPDDRQAPAEPGHRPGPDPRYFEDS